MTPEQQKALALARARRRREGAALEPQKGPRDSALGKIDTVVRGAADMLTLGLSDEIAAGLGALTGIGGERAEYAANLEEQRDIDRADAEERGLLRLGGQLLGGVGGGIGLARSGLSAGANAARAGHGLGRVAAGTAGEGAVLGAAHGFGSGEGREGRLANAAIGGAGGLALGAAAPYAIAGAGAAGRALAAPVMSRLRPDSYAQRALGEGVQRSGMNVDDISGALQRAHADDQGMFTVADAMGHSGQRMLSTVARTPNNARQQVIDALTERQMGQGERLSNAIAQGFDAPDTAAQRAARLSTERSAAADANYEAAREGAGFVNLNNAIGEIDRLLGRDPILGDTALSTGPLGARLRALRDQLQRGEEQLVDFDRVLNIKSDLYQQMQRNPQVANDMRDVYSALDAALENASEGYRAANDTFRQQSRAIDAVQEGSHATSGRRRAADTVGAFERMSPEEQAAFRAGYADPLIARIESASISPTTNRARPLMTEKTGQEFPAFAAPGEADRLGRRIAREQRMFETANAAMGGSKTADNLADAAEMSKFDPGVMMNLLRGRPIAAAIDAVTKMANEARGMPPSVMERIALALMETNPQAARRMLEQGASRTAQSDARRAVTNAILNNLGAGAVPRIAAP